MHHGDLRQVCGASACRQLLAVHGHVPCPRRCSRSLRLDASVRDKPRYPAILLQRSRRRSQTDAKFRPGSGAQHAERSCFSATGAAARTGGVMCVFSLSIISRSKFLLMQPSCDNRTPEAYAACTFHGIFVEPPLPEVKLRSNAASYWLHRWISSISQRPATCSATEPDGLWEGIDARSRSRGFGQHTHHSGFRGRQH